MTPRGEGEGVGQEATAHPSPPEPRLDTEGIDSEGNPAFPVAKNQGSDHHLAENRHHGQSPGALYQSAPLATLDPFALLGECPFLDADQRVQIGGAC